MAKLFYVIGASGAGKDSLIHYIRGSLPEDAPVMFAHRYITRPADAGGENHVALSAQEFAQRQQQGCFSMDWHSHETHYGIGSEIDEWLSKGLDVVVNGSREYLQEATKKYKNIVPILICVDPDLLADRLFARGRETFSQVSQRVAHAIKLEDTVYHPCLQKIENNGVLEEAGDQLLQIILDTEQEQCA
ncbi:MAG TPA: phosphonate metabolism protein/1,5-bisphosphokinase (PRPP-forming) PhnN [Gammaproteobacteria bacterium]|nr:phosphonate metabolism protein/1,5-bisphosphokinase (PRPP-forming) PhnN [Gammaproteobacteria bacterium]